MKRSLMAAIDLHSNNLFCGIVDAQGRHVFDKKLPGMGARLEKQKNLKKQAGARS